MATAFFVAREESWRIRVWAQLFYFNEIIIIMRCHPYYDQYNHYYIALR